MWTATTPEAAFLQIAEHCNREQFNALIGTSYPGIVVSDRWNGYQPSRPPPAPGVLVAPAARLPPPRRRAGRAEDLRRAGPRAHRAACSPPGAPTSTSTTTATGSRPRSRRSRPNYGSCSKHASPKSRRTRWHRQFANNLLKVWPALWTFTTIDGRRADQQPRRARAPRHRSSTENSRSAPKATTASDSPNARSPPPPPAACNAARCSPTSANYSPPTTAATHSPRSPEAPGTERLQLHRDLQVFPEIVSGPLRSNLLILVPGSGTRFRPADGVRMRSFLIFALETSV